MWEDIVVVVLVFAAIGLVFWLLTRPLALLKSLVVKSVVGLLLLLITNYLGSLVSFSIPVNIGSIAVAGFLGIPGVALLAYLKYFMW